MHAVLLDGTNPGDKLLETVAATLLERLRAQSFETEHFQLASERIAPCIGDLECLIKTPGQCRFDDDNRKIAAILANCEVVLYLTRISFGGYGSLLKRMMDHQLQNLLPFFDLIEGEIHHPQRYAGNPSMLVVGVSDSEDPREEALFRRLVWRNALNFQPRQTLCTVIPASANPAQAAEALDVLLSDFQRKQAQPVPMLPHYERSPAPNAPRKASILLGSPRGEDGTSWLLASLLVAKLQAHGVSADILKIPLQAKADSSFFSQAEQADLLLLCAPVYVDSLPAYVTSALELLATRPAFRSKRPHFAALVNGGLPEGRQLEVAVGICAAFAHRTGCPWAGGLTLGGGEVAGPLLREKKFGKLKSLLQSLELSAEALASGQALPERAFELCDRILAPRWVYRFFSGFYWRDRAKPFGAQGRLARQPYAKAPARSS